jgi:hypothetical protein
MHIVETQIHEEGGNSPAVRVEFCGDGGEVVSVFMRQSDDNHISRENAVAKARALMIQVGSFDGPSDYEQKYQEESNGDVTH